MLKWLEKLRKKAETLQVCHLRREARILIMSSVHIVRDVLHKWQLRDTFPNVKTRWINQNRLLALEAINKLRKDMECKEEGFKYFYYL